MHLVQLELIFFPEISKYYYYLINYFSLKQKYVEMSYKNYVPDQLF